MNEIKQNNLVLLPSQQPTIQQRAIVIEQLQTPLIALDELVRNIYYHITLGFIRTDTDVKTQLATLAISEDIVMRVYYLFSLDDSGSPQQDLEKNIDAELQAISQRYKTLQTKYFDQIQPDSSLKSDNLLQPYDLQSTLKGGAENIAYYTSELRYYDRMFALASLDRSSILNKMKQSVMTGITPVDALKLLLQRMTQYLIYVRVYCLALIQGLMNQQTLSFNVNNASASANVNDILQIKATTLAEQHTIIDVRYNIKTYCHVLTPTKNTNTTQDYLNAKQPSQEQRAIEQAKREERFKEAEKRAAQLTKVAEQSVERLRQYAEKGVTLNNVLEKMPNPSSLPRVDVKEIKKQEEKLAAQSKTLVNAITTTQCPQRPQNECQGITVQYHIYGNGTRAAEGTQAQQQLQNSHPVAEEKTKIKINL